MRAVWATTAEYPAAELGVSAHEWGAQRPEERLRGRF